MQPVKRYGQEAHGNRGKTKALRARALVFKGMRLSGTRPLAQPVHPSDVKGWGHHVSQLAQIDRLRAEGLSESAYGFNGLYQQEDVAG